MAYRHYRGDQLLSVQTGSMIPTFYPGDAIVTNKTALQKLLVGDIVAYHNPVNSKVIVSHRLISVNYKTGKLITEGDALDLQDVPFPSYLVAGKVDKVIPHAGLLLDWLHKPIGLLVAVYVPAVLVMATEAKTAFKTIRQAVLSAL